MSLTRRSSFSTTFIELVNPQQPNIKNIKVIQALQKITIKPLELRTQQQNNYLYNSLNYLKYVSKLSETTDRQAIKSILRSSKILFFSKDSHLFKPNTKHDFFYILIQGKIQLIFQKKQSQDQAMQNLLFEMIFHIVQTKKKSKQLTNNSQIKSSSSRIINQQQSFGDEMDKLFHKKNYTAKSIEDSYVVQIPLQMFMNTLKEYNIRRQQQIKSIFRKFKCFDILQDKPLMVLIKQSQEITQRKRCFVYNQGQKPRFIYILKKGELQIIKKSDSFLTQSFFEQERSSFCISPEKKNSGMIISVLNNQNMFGQEDIGKKSWSTSVKILSSQATYYRISYQKLEMVLKTQNFTLQDFIEHMQQKCSKKLKYRTNRFHQIKNIKNMSVELGRESSSPPKLNKSRILNRVNIQFQCHTERPSTADVKQMRQTVFSKTLLQTKSKMLVHDQLSTASFSRSKKLKSASSNQNQISFQNPLFDLKYFKQFQKDSKKKRQQRQKKMINLILSERSRPKTSRVINF